MGRWSVLAVLVALALASCGDGGTETTGAREAADGPEAAGTGGEPALAFRPVISPHGVCPEEPAPPTAPVPQETRPGQPSTTTQPQPPIPPPSTEPLPPGLEVVPTGQAGHCMVVGPAGLDGTALASAEAALDPSGGWVVRVAVVEHQRERANALFDACYEAQDTCPPNGAEGRGLLAIVLDGEIVSAPQVNSAGLADEPFTITGGGTGGFTRADADDLAARLSR